MALPAELHQPSGGAPSYGVILGLHIANRAFASEIQVAAAATSDSTVPLTTTAVQLARKSGGVSKHVHFLPTDGIRRFYRARHVADGWDPGPWTNWICSRPRALDGDPDGPVTWLGGGPGGGDPGDDPTAFESPFWSEGRRRGDTFYSTDGQLLKTTRITDDSGNFFLNRHNESGLAEHGEAVTFDADFESTPRITFVPQKAKVYSNSTDLGSTSIGSTAGQFMDIAAETLTVSGFTLRAVLASSQDSTAVIDGFSTDQNTAAPENGDVTMQAGGDVVYCNLEDADAGAAANYRGFFKIEGTSELGDALLGVELAFNSASTSTSFTPGDSRLFDADSTQEELSVNTQLGADYDLRLRTFYSPAAAEPDSSSLPTVTAFGEDSPQPGVQYNKISSGIEESMTPSTGQSVLWQATETP